MTGSTTPSMVGLPPELTAQELCRLLPDGAGAVPAESREGRRIRATLRNNLIHMSVNELMTSMRASHRGRRGGDVREHYEATYRDDAEEVAAGYARLGKPLPYRLGRHFVAHVEGGRVVRAITQRAGDIVEALAPESLCEVGCGHGRNLLYLANRFPSVPCTGFELAQSGVDTARRLQELDLPNTAYGRLYGLTAPGMDNVRRTSFRQASAFELPAADGAYDVVLTIAAVEQMQLGYRQALAEIRRIARRYVLFYEPFADANDVVQRLYLWLRNYFRLRSDALAAHGLEPIRVWTALPVKPTFAYAFVLCRPR